ncbi:MAG: fluoride efflux transporter CrcB [Candidatus Kapabacteria bacterium]|jgi:CrcB protein|nr:fluoride efflux transporter CrcB [Candidatus Kapabacteria bacterium]
MMPSWGNIGLVFLGGGLGSVLRLLVSVYAISRLGIGFPFGTLCVNVVGSFCIGVIVALAGERVQALSEAGRFFLAIGFCGGFTTFSTFSLETLTMLQSGRINGAAVYVAVSIIGCVVGTALGLGLVYWWWKNVVGEG